MKKIFALISLCLVGVLLITTVVMSLISKNYSPDISFEPMYVKVYHKGNTETYSATNEEYNKIISTMKKGFENNFLASLFQGKASVKPVVIERNSSYIPGFSSYNDVTEEYEYSVDTYTYVEFQFNAEQRVRENGKNYDSNTANTIDNPVYYTSLFVSVNTSEAGLADASIYYKDDNTFKHYYTLTLAKQAELFKYIDETLFA